MSREEDILQSIIDGGDPALLEPPQSRGETLLQAVHAKVKALHADVNELQNTGVDLVARAGVAENTSQLAENADNAALWRTATGNPATIYPVPKTRLYPRVELVAAQMGTGDPSPTNVRPIVPSLLTGQKVKAKRTGKNLLGNGVLSSASNMTFYKSTGFWVVAGTAYTLSCNFSASGIYVFLMPGGPTLHVAYSKTSLTFTPTATAFVYFDFYKDGGIPVGATFQLEYGSVATPYEPYSGADYDLLTADRDFYGLPGAPVIVDTEAGTVTVQDRLVIFKGTEPWTTNTIASGQRYFVFGLGAMNAYGNGDGLGVSDRYRHSTSGFSHIFYFGSAGNINLLIYPNSTAENVEIPDVAAWKSYLAAQYAAGTPVTVQYKLATPVVTPITPPVIAALDRISRTAARKNVLTATANDSTVWVQKFEVKYQEHPSKDYDYMSEKTGYGVLSGLVVAAQSTPDMTVQVSAGVAYMSNNTRYAPATVASLAVTAADATNPRIGIVYLSSEGVVSYLAGTAAATPAAPATPTGGLLLAEINVAANATTVAAANITLRKKGLWTEDWITPTLLNGSAHDPTNIVKYQKDHMGYVHFKGVLTNVTGGVTSIEMPTGYKSAVISRPRFLGLNNSYNAGVIEMINGSSIQIRTSASWISLDSIYYKAEA